MLSVRFFPTLSLLSVVFASLTPTDLSGLQNIVSGNGFIKFPVQTIQNTTMGSHRKRQDSLILTNSFTGTFYVVSLNIGSNAQPVVVDLDTGSSELWVNPDCSTASTTSLQTYCDGLPTYNPGTSTTSNDLGLPFSITYGTGSVFGTYYTDDVTCGSATIKTQQFGVATSSEELAEGILGIGPQTPDFSYPSVIENLAAQGIINSVAFSLDLRSVDQPTGSIIFGGIDSNKYRCQLQKMPIIPAAQSPDGFPRYWIYLDGVGQTVPGQAPKSYPTSTWNPDSNPNGLPVFLDSGGTLTRIPSTLFNAIAQDYPGATLDPSGSGLYIVPCNAPAGSIDFTFGANVIHVPYSEFIWIEDPVDSICYLGMAADDSGETVLGDSFLRGAYVVYDVANMNLWLDQADDCGSNIVAIGNGANSVPQINGCQCQSSSSSSSSIASTSSSSSSISSTISTSSSSVASISSSSSSSASSSAASSSASSSAASSSASSSMSSSSASSMASSSASSSMTSSSASSSATSSSASSSKASSSASSSVASSSVSPSSFSSVASSSAASSSSSRSTLQTTSSLSTITSTILSTTTYTITSCPPTITNCPVGHVTTSVTTITTTFCPGNETPTLRSNTRYVTSTFYSTNTITITKCPPQVTNCPAQSIITTTTVTPYTTVCPGSCNPIAPNHMSGTMSAAAPKLSTVYANSNGTVHSTSTYAPTGTGGAKISAPMVFQSTAAGMVVSTALLLSLVIVAIIT